jgi:hypothetical protein
MAKVEKRGAGQIASAEIKRSEESIAPKNFNERPDSKEDPREDDKEILDELLETPFYSLNHGVPEFRKEMISRDPRDLVTRWFFPNAEVEGKRTPTYVDYPQTKHEIAICEKKAAVMKKLGRRYIILQLDQDKRAAKANMIASGVVRGHAMENEETLVGEF